MTLRDGESVSGYVRQAALLMAETTPLYFPPYYIRVNYKLIRTGADILDRALHNENIICWVGSKFNNKFLLFVQRRKVPSKIENIRHSIAHLLAMAVLKKFPKVKLGIGPVIENGVYYDFLIEGKGERLARRSLGKGGGGERGKEAVLEPPKFPSGDFGSRTIAATIKASFDLFPPFVKGGRRDFISMIQVLRSLDRPARGNRKRSKTALFILGKSEKEKIEH